MNDYLTDATGPELTALAYQYLVTNSLPKLPRGYSWGKAYIQFDFSQDTTP